MIEYERERKREAKNLILDHLNNTLQYHIHDKDVKLFSHWQYKPSFRFIFNFNIDKLGLRQEYDENLSITEQIIIRPNQSNYANNPRANRTKNKTTKQNTDTAATLHTTPLSKECTEALEYVR